jgi:hypothetical protein
MKYIILILLLASCSTKKQATLTTTKTDSTFREVNLPINDKIFISIPEIRTINKDCDSLAQDAVVRFASGLRGEKQSGNNSYKYYWNGSNLVFDFQMGQTETEYRDRVHTRFEIVPEKYTPKWIQYFAWLGFVFILYICFKIYRYATHRKF